MVNRLGALSGAAGVCLVPCLPGPVPAPMGSGSSLALPGGLVMVVLLLALLVVLCLVRGWDPRVGLHPRGLSGRGLVVEGFVGFWWCAGLWVALDGCCCGLVVVKGSVWVWVWFVGFSGWCGLLVWVVLGLGWVWGLGWPGFC